MAIDNFPGLDLTALVGDLVNPFVAARTAERYGAGRPYHHERTLARILDAVAVHRGWAVDVAAGTGLSTRALAAHGFSPLGVDAVTSMLAEARRASRLQYAAACAEALPVADSVASLVTVSSGIHWFDQQGFFAEARRVLCPDGLVVVYDHSGVHLPGDKTFLEWFRTEYLERYPMPPRGAVAGNTDEPEGMHRCYNERWIDTVAFTHEGLVAYVLTQSNIVDAVESGRESEATIRSWLTTTTARFFDPDPERIFAFYVTAEALRIT